MAKTAGGPNSQKVSYQYPSVFGSHASMVDEENTNSLSTLGLEDIRGKYKYLGEEQSGLVVLKDEFGLYVTAKNRLDSGGADPNRYQYNRLSSMFSNKKEKG